LVKNLDADGREATGQLNLTSGEVPLLCRTDLAILSHEVISIFLLVIGLNLGWIIEKDGVQILDRSATAPFTNAPELTLSTDVQWFKGSEGKFRIYLTASGENGYVRVSNIIEYTN
jgi:hypothetical protein